MSPGNGSSFNYAFSYDGSSDVGFNTTAVNLLGNELAHVFDNELGNSGSYDTSGALQAGSGVTNMYPFSNLNNGIYWSGTDFIPHPGGAWAFMMFGGYQIHDDKGECITRGRCVLVQRPSFLLRRPFAFSAVR